MARDTSSHICTCVRPRGSAVGLSGGGRVTLSLISSEWKAKNENVNILEAIKFNSHEQKFVSWGNVLILTYFNFVTHLYVHTTHNRQYKF